MKYNVLVFLMLTLMLLSCKSDLKSGANQQVIEEADLKILAQGKTITSATFVALSSKLSEAMKSGGVSEAVNYCNLAAIPITDSLSTKYGVDIKRTSDRTRNTRNKASDRELEVIRKYKSQLKSGNIIKPTLAEINNQRVFYAPIIVSELCLKCHGQKDKMLEYDVIANLYPNDLATGYFTGDLRGIWSVTFRD